MASCEAETTKESIKTKLEAEIVSLSVFSKLLKAFFFFSNIFIDNHIN